MTTFKQASDLLKQHENKPQNELSAIERRALDICRWIGDGPKSMTQACLDLGFSKANILAASRLTGFIKVTGSKKLTVEVTAIAYSHLTTN